MGPTEGELGRSRSSQARFCKSPWRKSEEVRWHSTDFLPITMSAAPTSKPEPSSATPTTASCHRIGSPHPLAIQSTKTPSTNSSQQAHRTAPIRDVRSVLTSPVSAGQASLLAQRRFIGSKNQFRNLRLADRRGLEEIFGNFGSLVLALPWAPTALVVHNEAATEGERNEQEREDTMRFQLRECGWPLQGGRAFIPQGTIIDTDGPPAGDPWSPLVLALGLTRPPVNAQPLNQETYDLMREEFPAWRIITVPGLGGDGINRT